MSEDAARMRVERALGKLRGLLERRGVSSTAAALAVALTNPALAAVPAGLAGPIAGAALAGSGAATSAAAWATFMGVTKLQLGLAGALVVGGAAGFWVQEKMNDELRAESARLTEENAAYTALQTENRELKRVATEVRELRKDDVELARLQDEALALKAQIETAARAQAKVQASEKGIDGQEVLMPSQVDQVPKVVARGKPPSFPAEFRKAGVGGEATVQFIVDAAGQVRDVEAVSATDEAFGKAAVASVYTWTFEAGKKANIPVNVRMTVPMTFLLNPEDGDERSWF